jgi:N-formylglutamate amidohydrolase
LLEMEKNVENVTAAVLDPPAEVLQPSSQALPLVLASPHSGAVYPGDLIAASRLDPHALRRSEDSYVDEIFATAAASLGVPLLRARFARAYLDANREMYELDPAMFEEPLPSFVNSRSPRVQVGLGTIARIVSSGEEIYGRKLSYAEAEKRIETLYKPYHETLQRLLDATLARFGFHILVDCHSMPSAGAESRAGGVAAGRGRVDIVLGDCHGTSCHPLVQETAHRVLTARGYVVARNSPYAGGFTTAHYGRPADERHALQIEINRSLYMDERTLRRRPYFRQLAADMGEVIAALGRLDRAALQPQRRAAE